MELQLCGMHLELETKTSSHARAPCPHSIPHNFLIAAGDHRGMKRAADTYRSG